MVCSVTIMCVWHMSNVKKCDARDVHCDAGGDKTGAGGVQCDAEGVQFDAGGGQPGA